MSAALTLYICAGGAIMLPASTGVLVDRSDGGNLVVNPPRTVWERSALDVAELTAWGHLVAAAGQAMLTVLPQLEGGCINYWEAGNWALNEDAHPKGPKTAPQHRQVHLHLLGRSRNATDMDWEWGEAPRFPSFADRLGWSARKARLTADECVEIVSQADTLLKEKFAMAERRSWGRCKICDYPVSTGAQHECRP